ncbi:MAG: monofunctional biosynthetic peptidoglycan transglycosylase [Deltaproteobacteria bacterium]|nr:monofunctional biosynthetic peptidoglycan transglycosylase [Deltaproteobacteria bacterium]
MTQKKKFAALKKEIREKGKTVAKRLLIALVLLHIVHIAWCKWIHPPLTATQFGAVLEGYTFNRETVPLDQISPHLQLAVIASEDQLFAVHDGFDVTGIKNAIAHNQTGKSLRGASTISQQTAKNIFLWQGRNWLRKGLEVYYTFLMEKLYGKKRILELYLNQVEMGKGIFGAQAAAHTYFNKSAKSLTRIEAARIAASLPNPKKLNPAKPDAHMKKKVRWILSQMAYLQKRPATRKLLSR